MNVLSNQKTILEEEMSTVNSQINDLKDKITADFLKNDAQASYENIENYIKIKEKYNYARTYLIYTNQFLQDYNTLNEYNKKLLDTLINNKTAIIKEAYIVIPDTGVELLRDFNLLYSENEYKEIQKSN
ncbi:MAG: hypothetical protein LBU14_05615 [Candidatus Peribacteria bacterium]|jgi:hypothetical protein|nr:hypothetical protein [Candidatus Peribacteria bacterium]